MNTTHSYKVPIDSLFGKLVCKNYLLLSKINEGSLVQFIRSFVKLNKIIIQSKKRPGI